MAQLSRLAQMQEAIEASDVKRIIDIMKKNNDSTLVQERGSNALGDLAYCQRRQIVLEGGVEAVIDAIIAHKWHARMAELGCRCLGNLAFHAINTARVVAKGGITTVVQAMNSHKGDRAVQIMGCGALSNMALNPTYAEWIVRDGGAAAVIYAMSAFKVSTCFLEIEIVDISSIIQRFIPR